MNTNEVRQTITAGMLHSEDSLFHGWSTYISFIKALTVLMNNDKAEFSW